MSFEEPTQAEQDDIVGDVVALLAAMRRGDQAGAYAVVDGITPERMAAIASVACGLVASLGPVAFGDERWERALSTWQPGMKLTDIQ